MYAGRLGEPHGLRKIAEAAQPTVQNLPAPHRPIDLLLSGLVQRFIAGPGAGADLLRAALESMCERERQNDGQALRWMSLGLTILQDSAAFGELWDETLWQELATVMVRQARDAGALAVLPPALAYRAGVDVFSGEFDTAAALFDEAQAISSATGYAPLRYHALSLAAWRGVPEDALGLLKAAAAEAVTRGEGRALDAIDGLTAVLYNGLGRYDQAFAAVRGACEFENFGFHGWCLLELVEAASRTGDQETAESAVRRLAERAGGSATDWGLGAVASAQALLAHNDSADELFTEAIDRLERTRVRVYHARVSLLYGEWLRRMNRRVDARQHLGEAHRMFTDMGAQAFAEPARRELLAAGDKVRAQPIGSGDRLTAQEAQIARLAAEGLTNQEIGAQLFISTHTVEWHLRKVFAKLGITSRRQLRALPGT